MSKINSKTLSFVPSDSPDVVGYKLYLQETPDAVSYDSQSFDLGTNTSVDLGTLPGLENVDGIFNIGIVAIDDAGNESDMSIASDVPLDFVAPNPPGAISFI